MISAILCDQKFNFLLKSTSLNYQLIISIKEMGNNLNAKKEKKIKSRDLKLIQQRVRLQNFARQLNIDDQMTKNVINSSATQLVEMLNKSQITSQQIVIIYSLRAVNVGSELNLITEDNFEQALLMAQNCDKMRKETGKRNWILGDPWNNEKFLPPLFGIPTSVKDTIDMNGFSSTVGCINRIDQIHTDGSIMHCFRNSGIIPFVRTNIPQLAFTFESVNNLWGCSLNPWDKTRTVGGSSGGEAGMIAAKASVIGVGSDQGGSLRIPAQFCGIYSLKPFSNRLSFAGHNPYAVSFSGNSNINSTMGPLARCVDDLALWMKTILTEQFYKGENDPYIKLFPFDQSKYLSTSKAQKLRIGYIRELQFTQPTAASKRAIIQIKNKLQSLGHELVQLFIPNEKEIIGCFLSEISSDGNLRTFRQMLKGQSLIPQYRLLGFTQGLNRFNYKILTSILKILQPRLGFCMEKNRPKNVYDYLHNAGTIKQHKKQFTNYLKSQRVDVLISPGFGSQACKHGKADAISMAAVYTFVWNVLDLVSGSMPITVVKQGQDIYQGKHWDLLNLGLKKSTEGSVGMPVGIQVVGVPYSQQKVLGVMKIIEKQVQFYSKHPLPIY